MTEKQLKAVKNIQNGGEHLLELINELLDLASIEAGKLQLTIEEHSLQKIIDECYSLVHPLTSKLNLQLDFDRCDGYFIQADSVRFKQIVINLLSNAIKYNRPNGSVKMRYRCARGNQLRLSVIDTGVGLDKEQQARLFQPFERVGAEALEVEGAGVGLVISKKLMELMGGSVGVESVKGVGSTFWLDIACRCDDRVVTSDTLESPHQPHSSSENQSMNKIMRILYIEDSSANLKLVREIIDSIPNYQLYEACEPKLGLELAIAHKPDLILLDINLPGLDGYAVLKALRENASLSKIPVYAISANAMAADCKHGLEAGFNEYITKPLDVTKFIEALRRAELAMS